ncbi:MAG: OPT family oligopeptide transporter [Polyangiaceae bacterium]
MPLFQDAPATLDDVERARPLDLKPSDIDAMSEADWYVKAYRGDATPQLTVRAVVMGMILGFFLSFMNLYIGLKTGWHLGVSITACVVSFSVWNAFVKFGLAKTPMTILENNCMQSTASAAGYSTGNSVVSAIPALFMLSVTLDAPDGKHLPWPVVAAWVLLLACLGVALAVPMKRNMVNQERLTFPTGTASAATLQSLYSKGEEAKTNARALFVAGAFGMLVPVLKDLKIRKLTTVVDGVENVVRKTLLPGESPVFDFLPNVMAGGKPRALSDFNIVLDHSLLLVGAGAIVGLRVTLSMVVGALVQALWIGPIALGWSWTSPSGKVLTAANAPGTVWKEIAIWAGAPLMVTSGLLMFAMQWRTIVRAFQGLAKSGKDTGDATSAEEDLVAKTEVPIRWFAMGTAIAGVLVVIVAWQAFGIAPWFGALAVLMTFVLALVACRATGETDLTPSSAMGKIMQLTYGKLIPQNPTANLMTASITSGAGVAAADLLSDLKSGYLLGANPRRQFVAQALGIPVGTAGTVIGWYLLVPNVSLLNGDATHRATFPAPAAQQWKAVAALFTTGIENLHPFARQLIVIGGVVGIVLALGESLAGKRAKKYLPSATGIGLGLILPFPSSFAMFLGAVLATVFFMVDKEKAERFVVPVSSGVIAGESILGVVVAAANNFFLTG